jgi:acyl-CoA thioesterase FadM
MGTLIGFKHLLYLVEEAVLQWFRHHGYGPHLLLREHGLALQVVDLSARLMRVLDIDDEVTAEVTMSQPGRFTVELSSTRDGDAVTVLRARATVELFGPAPLPRSFLPSELLPLVTDSVVTRVAARRHNHRIPRRLSAREVLAPQGSNTFWWAWTARYLYCHYFDRVQHSGYIRALEEGVDRFLADSGLGIRSVLAERGWVPVVSKVHVQLLAAAHMDETIHTTLTVEGVSERTYDIRMDCHAERGSELSHVATAAITHGYIQAGVLAVQALPLGTDIVRALTGK